MPKRKGPTKVNRSAKTGKFVKESYAKKHKSTTYTDTLRKGKKRM